MLRPFIFAASLSLFPTFAGGHNDVSETIRALTSRLAENPSARLYYQRATEFRALREKEHAIEDLRSALKLNPGFRAAKISLIRELGKSDEALAMATVYTTDHHNAGSGVEATYLLTRVLHLRGENETALILCKKIQDLSKNHEPGIDILHAEVLLDLQRPAMASRVLKDAWKRTNSIVLRNNWIDTALTAGETREVLPVIEKELSSSRFRSSWLIRRARAALIHGDQEQADSDLRAALAELTPRIRPDRPDLTLIADRGLAHALLGQTPKAKADLSLLQKSSLPPSFYRLLTDTLDR
jgi:tetratricopeptide (TPR) repeat protein